MKRRIVMWAVVGLVVAGFWAIFALPASTERMREAWPLVSITCPVAILGERYPIALYEALITNALTYAIIGLIVELFGKRLFHCEPSKPQGLGPLRHG
jgi:predicted cobalt transporter CbtA